MTTDILNIVKNSDEQFYYYDTLYSKLCDLYHSRNYKPVQAFKKVFGKQSEMFQGEYRMWVWNFIDGVKVYVSNVKGVCIEVPKEFTPKQACLSVDGIYNLMFLNL